MLREEAQKAAKQTNLQRENDDEDTTLANEGGADEDSEDTSEENDLGFAVDMTDIVEFLPYSRLGCLCHTLQLLIMEVYNSDEYKEILHRARRLVGTVRKSSIAMEKIVSKCGKTLISDNTTRWNSTYLMVKRLLVVKTHINEILEEMKMDSLLNSEWVVLEEVVSLLEPFREQTDILQTDACSLSNVIPSLLELECHLDQFPSSRLTESMKCNLRKQFGFLLETTERNFNPLPAAACLLDPTCASVILGFDTSALREKAKDYILTQVSKVK